MQKVMSKIGKIGIIITLSAGLGSFLCLPPAGADLINVKVSTQDKTGAEVPDGGGATVTITPDWNGDRDMASIRFSSTETSGVLTGKVWVDTNRDSVFDNDDWMMEYNQTAPGAQWWFSWEGRDKDWRPVANGIYGVKVSDGITSDDTTLTITTETGSITGTVKDASGSGIAGAEVEAHGPYGWAETVANDQGVFVLSGLSLEKDADNNYKAYYELETRADGYISKQLLKDDGSWKQIRVGTDTGVDFVLTQGKTLSITAKLVNADGSAAEFTSFTDEWGGQRSDLYVNINVWASNNPTWAWEDVRLYAADWDGFNSPTDDWDNDGVVNADEPTSSGTVSLTLSPGTYNARAEAEGWGSLEYRNIIVAEDGTVTYPDAMTTDGVIKLTKAGSISGTLALPEIPTDPWTGQTLTHDIWVEVTAVDSAGNMYWGGGQAGWDWDADPAPAPSQSGQFNIRSVPIGETYTVTVRVPGYSPKQETGVSVTTDMPDVALGELTITAGSKISGTVQITGDTTGVYIHGSNEGPINLWVNAWSHADNVYGGTNVSVPRGTNESGTYTIKGLGEGTYEVDLWIEGLEKTAPTGYPPYQVAAGGTMNFTFAKPDGKIKGTVTAATGTMIPAQVVVVVRSLGWGHGGMQAQPKVVNSDGTFEFTGLASGDYIVSANEYSDIPVEGMSYYYPGMLTATGNYGTEQSSRLALNSGATKTVDLTLKAGATISGTVSMADGNPGDPDGPPIGYAAVEDLKDPWSGEMATVEAFKMQDKFMMGDESMGANDAFQAEIDPNTGAYTISGLSKGVYQLEFFKWFDRSNDVEDMDGDNDIDEDDHNRSMEMGGMRMLSPDVAAQSQTVVVDPSEPDKKTITNVDFVIQEGVTVKGTISLPEAPADPWQWIGHLHLAHSRHHGWGNSVEFMGWKFVKANINWATKDPDSFTENDFTKSSDFKFEHVYYDSSKTTYVLDFYSDKFVNDWREVDLSEHDNGVVEGIGLNMSKGASIVGKLVDENGTAVTNVSVRCEARPWKEGSWRETWQDQWSASYIETGEDNNSEVSGVNRMNGDPNGTKGKFHLSNLPAGKYVVWVTASWGRKTDGTKNYVNVIKAGIDVPQAKVDAAGDVDIGTLTLREGVTITGTVQDESGNYLPNIDMEAEPMNSHLGWMVSSCGVTDAKGFYTIYGVDPEVKYWEVAAGVRDDWFMQKPTEYGEKWKENVAVVSTGATGIDFTLKKADVNLRGTINIPEGSSFAMPPFEDDMENMPSCLIILQNQDELWFADDPLDGIEVISEPSDGTSTTFTASNLVPGTYTLYVYSTGLTTEARKDIVITTADTSYNLDVMEGQGAITLSAGGAVTGTVKRANEIDKAVYEVDVGECLAMAADFSNMVFGKLIYNSRSKEIDTYEIDGLKIGKAYRIVFTKPGSEGEDIMLMPGTVSVAADGTITQVSGAATTTIAPPEGVDQVLSMAAPEFFAAAKRGDFDENGNSDFDIWIYSSTYLNEGQTEVAEYAVVDIKEGTGTQAQLTVNGGAYGMSSDKREIYVNYEPVSADGTSFTVTVTAHNTEGVSSDSDALTDGEQAYEFTFSTTANSFNTVQIGLSGGKASLGGLEDDPSSVFFEPGDIAEAEGQENGKADVTISSIENTSGGVGTSSLRALGVRAMMVKDMRLGVMEVVPDDPENIKSKMYSFGLSSGDSINTDETASLTLRYYTAADNIAEGKQVGADDLSDGKISICRYNTSYAGGKSADGNWEYPANWEPVVLDDSWIINTDNNTITAEISDFSIFAVMAAGSVTSSPAAVLAGGAAVCPIATATYGTPMAEEIGTLVDFRDQHLKNYAAGRWFIGVYYNKIGPPAAAFIEKHSRLKPVMRVLLKPLVKFSEWTTNGKEE